MPLSASAVLTRAAELLSDTANVRWTAAELLRWLNDGRRELAITRPDLYATTAVIDLVAGTRQSIPNDGTRFIDAIRNMEANGTTPGLAIRPTQRETLDAQFPSWHLATSGVTRHFMFDERVPQAFYVYPPAVAAAKVEIAYAREPADITNTADPLTAEGLYSNALIDYVLYRAFSKDATYAGNQQRADSAYQRFRLAIGEGDARDLTTSPNPSRADGSPPKGGG